MGYKVLAAASVAAATLLGAAGAASAVGAPAPSTDAPAASCGADSQWPGYVQGRPDGFDAHDNGVYLWHKPEGGWALRVSHPLLPGGANDVAFSGRIATKGTIGNVQRVRDEKGDDVKVSPNGHELTFRLNNHGWVDGVDFTTTCAPALVVGLEADGQRVQTRYIHLGDHKANPGTNPFRIRRVDSGPATSGPA